jgi:hypothetical protein
MATKSGTSGAKKVASKGAKAVAKSSPKGTTQPTAADVSDFIDALADPTRADCAAIDAWMSKAAGPPMMYGKTIVGYGTKQILYAGGREAPWMKMGFAPRKGTLVLYGLLGPGGGPLLSKLGKHTTGKGCLYVKQLADIDPNILKQLISLAAKG